MRFILGLLVAGLMTVTAAAQPWYFRGDFNTHGLDNPMTQDPMDPTHYTASVTGLFDDRYGQRPASRHVYVRYRYLRLQVSWRRRRSAECLGQFDRRYFRQ